MRGQILAYVADKEMGLIATAEGQRLSFRAADWLEVIAPERGMAVECVALDAHRAGQVQLALPEPMAAPPAPPPLAQRPKRKPVLTLLALFLGYYGAHRFYMGAWGWGLVQLLGRPVLVGILLALLPPLGVLLLLGGSRVHHRRIRPLHLDERCGIRCQGADLPGHAAWAVLRLLVRRRHAAARPPGHRGLAGTHARQRGRGIRLHRPVQSRSFTASAAPAGNRYRTKPQIARAARLPPAVSGNAAGRP